MNSGSGKEKLIRDISANTLQIVIIQVFSLVLFYFTSRYLAKKDFGELNWSTAVGSTIIAIASLGLDVVFVKRLASGQNALIMSGIHFFHTLIVGLVLSFLVLTFYAVFPSVRQNHPLFLLVFINLCILNIANSFKLCLTGLEVYKYLAVIAFVTNIFKFVSVIVLYRSEGFFIQNIVLIFIITSLLEFLIGYYFVNKILSNNLTPVWRLTEYKYFIMESLPQLGVVFFDSAMARIDWILLGIITTAATTAEYSFAYRMYESAKLPLIVISPILLTRFSRIFMNPDKIIESNRAEIDIFFKLELFVLMLIPVTLICVWSPLIDYFTDNKYGAVDEMTFMILAACIPMHGIMNFLWSLGFAQGQLKAILFITISAAGANFMLNLFLIPVYGGIGAAWAFLLSTALQTGLYARYIRQQQIKLNIKNCGLAFINAIVAVLAAKFFANNVIFAAAIAIGMFTFLAFITRQINYSQLKAVIKP